MRRFHVAARLLAFAALAALAACGQYGSVGLERRDIADYYSVDPQIDWSRYNDGGMEVWTVDGVFLDALQFSAALENGDKLYDISGKDDVPLFRSNMTESEVMEFVADALIGLDSGAKADLTQCAFDEDI